MGVAITVYFLICSIIFLYLCKNLFVTKKVMTTFACFLVVVFIGFWILSWFLNLDLSIRISKLEDIRKIERYSCNERVRNLAYLVTKYVKRHDVEDVLPNYLGLAVDTEKKDNVTFEGMKFYFNDDGTIKEITEMYTEDGKHVIIYGTKKEALEKE